MVKKHTVKFAKIMSLENYHVYDVSFTVLVVHLTNVMV